MDLLCKVHALSEVPVFARTLLWEPNDFRVMTGYSSLVIFYSELSDQTRACIYNFVRCPIRMHASSASQISHRISVRQLPKSSSNFSQVLKFRVGPPVPQSNDDQVHDAWCWTARCCSGEYLCHDASGTLAQWSSSPTSISDILMHIREQRSRVDRGIQSRWIILSWSNFIIPTWLAPRSEEAFRGGDGL